MQKSEVREDIKKNLLDLQYHRYLQYYNTSVIILFTYFIGIAVAFITKQINYKNSNQLLLVAIISVVVILVIVILMFKFKDHMANILQEIRNLKL